MTPVRNMECGALCRRTISGDLGVIQSVPVHGVGVSGLGANELDVLAYHPAEFSFLY